MGFGHVDALPIIDALRGIGYDRYLSAEVFRCRMPQQQRDR